MDKETQLIAQAIVATVKNEKAKLYALLLKNGVVLPSNTSDENMSKVVSELLKKSKSFRKEFVDLAVNNVYTSSNMSNFSYMDGGFDFGQYTVAPSPFSTSTSSTSSTVTDKAKNGFFTTSNLTDLFNKGLGTYMTLDKNKTDRDLAKASIAQSNAGIIPIGSTTVDSINSNNRNPNSNSNTTLYIVLGVLGVAILGGVVWYANTKK